MLALSVVLMGTVCGCMASSNEDIRENEALIERVRAKVFVSALELSMPERDAVKSQPPKIRVYRLAGDYVDYHFEWPVDGARIVVRGKGKLSDLEGGGVKKIVSTQE
jgi:hypothetical protein